jgi:Amt family ammonium transporter
VLGKVAEVLRRRPRPNALCGRLSGDRFAVFLPGCTAAGAADVAGMIQAQCSGIRCPRDDASTPVSVSIGVAEMPEGPSAFDHGLARAEVACKAARLQARGSVRVHEPGVQAAPLDPAEAALLGEVRAGLDRHGFMLYAQPMQALGASQSAPCFELLLRLKGTGRETAGPAKFLAVATRHGLMTRIDQWVVTEVLRILRSHATALAGGDVRFSINLSASAVDDESFHAFLEAQVRDSGVAPAMLCFELSESTAAASVSRADRLMQRLRLLGCRFALDDFGTGLSSLAQLRTLPVSLLKIDGGLVREASGSQRTEAMVRAIAQLAHAMGMETVAECVESDESRTRMAALGIDYGQGFAIGRPAPLDEVLADLALYGAVAGWS